MISTVFPSATMCQLTAWSTEAFYKAIIVMVVTLFSFHSAEEQQLFFKQERPDEATIGSLGQTLALDCEAGGSPSPTIHWLYNGERIIQVRHLIHST